MASSQLETVIDKLNSETAVKTAGFALGFLYEYKLNKKTLHQPLSTIFEAALAGMLTSWGASIVGGYLPPKFRCVIPLSVIVSCVYYKYCDLYVKKDSKKCCNPHCKCGPSCHCKPDCLCNSCIDQDQDQDQDQDEDDEVNEAKCCNTAIANL